MNDETNPFNLISRIERLQAGLTHPQIHVDYYAWLSGLNETDREFMQRTTPHGLAMWAWSRSRETLLEATRNAVPAHDWPKPIPGRRGKEVRCKRCGRYSNEGDGPCVPAVAGESEVRS